jgi:membrane-associated phospholipid phosphatase
MPKSSFRAAGGALAAFALAALAACTMPDAGGPTAPRAPSLSQAPAHGAAPASVEWNAVARGLVAKNRSNVFAAFRVYALTGAAALRALEAAEAASSGGNVVSRRAAIAAASSEVLARLYPGDAEALEAMLREQVESAEWLERDGVDAAAGEALGRAAAAGVLDEASTDGYTDPWTGTVPTGPGMWYSITTPPTPPAGATIADARPWLLLSPDQFRPPPPPAFGSPAFLADLAEVRRISDTRTPEQDAIAKFWAMGAGTHTPPGYWNERASEMALRYRLNESRAARLLALLNMVAVDAIIASNDAKLAYWLLRPSQADPAITLAIAPLPNFPAYPSNHATISAAMAEVLAVAFPNRADELRAAADEAALSRVYGGIHYRFDGDAGLALGRAVARWGIAADETHATR